MADKYITQLTAATGLSTADLLAVETGVGGTPETKKATLDLLLDMIWTPRYVITPSVASNNLTVAIKDQAGNNASSTNPISFRVGNTRYDLTAAASTTKNAGTNWCNAGSAALAAKDVDYFVYAIGETGASAGLKFGFSRIPYALTMNDFVNTSTSEKYIAGSWSNFNATDPVANIGRFRARLSAGAGYTWSIPTAVVVNRPVYETGILSWTPASSASGSMTWSSATINVAEYQVVGNRLALDLKATGTTAGTASTELRLTLPFEARNVTYATPPGTAWVTDGGAAIAAVCYPTAGTPDMLAGTRYDGANYGLGATRILCASGAYMIA